MRVLTRAVCRDNALAHLVILQQSFELGVGVFQISMVKFEPAFVNGND